MSNILNSKYLDPTNDIAFKKLFFQKDLMIHFLNTVLHLEGENKIVDLDYLPQEQAPVIGELKRTIVDVKVYDVAKRHYIVEMQTSHVEEFIKRTEYYGALAITTQIDIGESYARIEPVIVICITKNHLALKGDDLEIISYHKTLETKTGKCYFKNLSYVLIELERFNKQNPEELTSIQDHWLYYFKYVQKSKDIPQNLKIPEIQKAYSTLDRFNWTKPELEEYVKAGLYIETERLNLEAKYEEGRLEGEKNKQIEIAKNLLKKGISIELISSCTGLKIGEINALNL